MSIDVNGLLERVGPIQSLDGHDGRSGATVGRALLDDGTPVIVKRSFPEKDLTTTIGGLGDRELRLFEAGVLDRLPSPLSHAVLAAGWVDGAVVTVMRDLGSAVLSWEGTLSSEDVHRMFAAVASMHTAFADTPPDDLCDFEARLAAFAPDRLTQVEGEMPTLILKGWERFADLAPDDVSAAVFAVLAQPERLASALGDSPMTMLHGDFWLPNLALSEDEVTLLDWAIATRGPGIHDFMTFAVGCASHVAMSREALVDEIRATTASYTSDEMFRVALFCGLTELGWNKALDAVDHDDPRQRAAARTELEWWIVRARGALETGRISA